MKFNHVSTAALAAAFLATAAAAQNGEDIVVTATRADGGVDRALYGGSVTIVGSEALEERQVRQLSDVLRDVPGIAVSRSGGVGGLTQIRMRGAEANHTLILIDGIEAADPFRGGEIDFATLIAEEAARIEVLRGPQSALYGSDAIAGAISVTTATGAEAPGLRGRIEAGTFGSVGGALRYGGADGGLDYVLSGAVDVTDGTPTARDGTRDLDAATANLSAKLGYEIAPNLRVKAVGRYNRTEAETNAQDFDFASPTYGLVVDTDDDYTNEAVYGLLRAELDLLDGRWSHALTGQVNDTDREERAGGDPVFSSEGDRLKSSYETSLRFGSGAVRHVLTGAADVERERFRNVATFGPAGPGNARRRIDNVGLVAAYDLAVGDRLGLGAAIRHDGNDRFGDATTYSVRANVRASGGLHLRAAAGSGIKNPSIFELFGYDPGTFVGNPGLKPERSNSWEAGADLALRGGGIRIGATYFEADLEDEIYTIYSPTFEASPANRDTESKRRGVELFANGRLSPSLRLDLAYSWTDAEEDGARELRRPKHIGSANLNWRGFDDRLSVTGTLRYNGVAYDTDFRDYSRARLDDYVLGQIAADYSLVPRVSLFGRVENLFDADYEDVFSYRTPGRAAYLGIRGRF